MAIGLEKVSFHSHPKERQCQRMFNYLTTALIFSSVAQSCPTLCDPMNHSTLGLPVHTIRLKILQARLQQYVNHELPDVQAGFRKGRGTRDQIANIHWITEKAREFQKNIYFCIIDYTKAFACVDHNKLCKIL